MNIQISISEDIYKKFQAALILTDEKEDVVLGNLISKYAHETFKKAMVKTLDDNNADINEKEQRQLFTNWFRSLTKNGKPYNLVTISGYAGRLENACSNPLFDSIPVNNLFTVTDFDEFIVIQKQIKECSVYSEFDAKSHNGFTAALKKYEEFLKFQSTDDSVPNIIATSQTSSYNSDDANRT